MSYIYIHLDPISKVVTTKGLNSMDFLHKAKNRPKNLLLLDTHFDLGELNEHLNLRMVTGVEEVERFFQRVRNRRYEEEIKWIDFSDEKLLNTLTSLELSELLYLGHMKKSLYSPFFYKLQNNFVSFEYSFSTMKTYYRDLSEFNDILSSKICRIIAQRINAKKAIFSRRVFISPIGEGVWECLAQYLSDGLGIDFEQGQVINGEYFLPLYHVKEIENRPNPEDLQIKLVYNPHEKHWRLEKQMALLMS